MNDSIHCYNFDEEILSKVDFWIEGIFSCSIATLGIFGNMGACYILYRKEMRNSFNLLLIALSCFDNFYLFCGVLESLKTFNMETKIHTLLFPYFLYPFQMMAMTGSILLTVAIALERYRAVHFPLNYSQNMNDSVALKQRMIKYLVPVSILSVLFNVTKFFEAKLVYASIYNETTIYSSPNFHPKLKEEYLVPYVAPTSLRLDPNYSIYFNWFRFITIGVIPFGLLVLFNAKIYADLKAHSIRCISGISRVNKSRGNKSSQRVKSTKPTENILREENQTGSKLDLKEEEALVMEPIMEKEQCALNNSNTLANDSTPKQTTPEILVKLNNEIEIPRLSDHRANAKRRRLEDHLASIFMVYILVFLICHSPRLMLNIYELIIIRKAIECTRLGLPPFPLWCLIMTCISHFLLILNSSTNILIYCILSSQFRQQCVKVASKLRLTVSTS